MTAADLGYSPLTRGLQHGVTLPSAAMHYPHRHPAVTGVVIGMRSSEEVEQNTRSRDADIPHGLWSDLVEHGYVPSAGVRTT